MFVGAKVLLHFSDLRVKETILPVDEIEVFAAKKNFSGPRDICHIDPTYCARLRE